MPIRKQTLTTGFQSGVNPFVGPIDHTVSVPVDLSAMTNKEIDEDGYLKPAIPLTKAGALLDTADPVFGVTVEAIKEQQHQIDDLKQTSTDLQQQVEDLIRRVAAKHRDNAAEMN